MTAPTQPRLTEAQFQSQVVGLAKMLGWHVYHTFLSKWSQPGFPDLTMVRPKDRRLIFAELKGEKGRLTEAQAEWMQTLGSLSGLWTAEGGGIGTQIEVHVWRPSDFDAISEALR